MKHLPLCCVNHISRVVSNVSASTAFYRDVLGFQEVKRPSSFDFEGSWLWSYAVGIHLIEGQPVSRPGKIEPKSDHLSFQAESLEEVQQRLRELGIAYVKQTIVECGQVVEQVFFHDPDNNVIEVCNCEILNPQPILTGEPAAAHTDANNNCASLLDSGDEDETGFGPAYFATRVQSGA